MEIWRDIPGYEGRYQVSSEGRVRSTTRILQRSIHRDGYAQVKLCRGMNDQQTKLVHRLVADAFVANPNAFSEVDHIDAVKQNNAARNLEWVSRSENMQRAQRMGLLKQADNTGVRNGMAKLDEHSVLRIRAAIAAGNTQQSVADSFGVSRRAIGMIVKRERWAHVQ